MAHLIKNTLKSTLLFSLFIASISQAADIKANATIKSVTIYPGSAKITRHSRVTVSPGNNTITINNLPVNLDENSLRISGNAAVSVVMGSVELVKNIQRDVVQTKEKNLREKIESVMEQKKEVIDALSRNRSQLDYIQRMVLGNSNTPIPNENNRPKNSAYTDLPLEQWTKAWQTLDTATASVQEKIRLAERSIRHTDKELNRLNRELRQVAVNQSATRSATLQVESPSNTVLDLKISYQINGARWSPVYDADLNTQTGITHFKTLAQISQRTGEDWKDVKVTLSTLRPSAGTQLPVLNPWVIDFLPQFNDAGSVSNTMMYQQKRKMNKSLMMEADEALVVEAMPVPVPKRDKEMQQREANVVNSDFSAEYVVPGLISLDSGSHKRRFALGSQSFQSDIHLASAPRFDPRAMILAKFNYEEETPLLAGHLSLYRNGNYVGNTYLSQKQSGEEVKLSFGEDDKVKIKFIPDPDKKRKDGLLFGKKKVVERHYQVSITNNHTKPFSISLYDTFPVASNEDIKVTKTGDLPNRMKVDGKEGVVSWDRELSPQDKLKIKYGYTVSYPEDKIIPSL